MGKYSKYKVRHIKNCKNEFLMSAKNDFCFKRLFGDENNKDILIAFLSAVMRIKAEKFEELELINTELIREFNEDRQGILDVRAKLKDGTQIDIEIQLSNTRYMAERTLFYWSKMYTGTIESGDSFSKLKRCVTINILDFYATTVESAYSKYNLREEKTGYKLTDVLEIYYLELPKLKDILIFKNTDESDPIIQWMMFLAAENKEVLDMLGEVSEEIKKATNILEIMSKDKEARMLYEAREAQLHDIATNLEEAEERGETRGLEKGLEIGSNRKAIEIAKNLIIIGVSLDKISEGTGLRKSEIEEIKNQMNN